MTPSATRRETRPHAPCRRGEVAIEGGIWERAIAGRVLRDPAGTERGEAAEAAQSLRAAVRSIDVRQVTGSDTISLTGAWAPPRTPRRPRRQGAGARAFERMWEARNAGGTGSSWRVTHEGRLPNAALRVESFPSCHRRKSRRCGHIAGVELAAVRPFFTRATPAMTCTS